MKNFNETKDSKKHKNQLPPKNLSFMLMKMKTKYKKTQIS